MQLMSCRYVGKPLKSTTELEGEEAAVREEVFIKEELIMREEQDLSEHAPISCSL